MNKNSAPISEKAWQEIYDNAKKSLTNFLSARKSLLVKGPYGKDYGVVNEGRLEEIKEKNGVSFANYKVKALTEFRIDFTLDKWELDNIDRGAEDPNLDALEEACEKIALFEDSVIYNGLKEAGIKGIIEMASEKTKTLGKDADEISKNISLGVNHLERKYAHKPFDLIVCPETLAKIRSSISVKNLYEVIEDTIGGSIILSNAIKGAILIPRNDEDLQLIIGEDLKIGYQNSDGRNINLYITESFTSRILDEDKILVYK